MAPGDEAASGAAPLPPKRQQVFVRADDLRRALEAADPRALKALQDQYHAHRNHPTAGQQPVVLALDHPWSWVTPLSDDPNSPWARALPVPREQDARLAGRELARFGKGFLVNGPVHLVTGLPATVGALSPGVQMARQVEDLRRAAADPQGLVAGYEQIAQERRAALVAEVKRLTSTAEGGGELLFDLASLFVGSEEAAAAGLEGRVRPLEPAPRIVPEAPTMPTEPAPGRVPEVPARPVEAAPSSVPGVAERPASPASASSGKTSELGDALSGLGNDPLGRNLNTLDEFGEGAGFSGVYDVESGKFLAYPSGETRLLKGDKPLNLVDQIGGHSDVNQVLSKLLGKDSQNRLGFVMIVDEDGNIAVRYNSGINTRNPKVLQRSVPESQRQSILDAITKVTGKKAYSDEY